VKPARISFSILLPILELTLWLVIVAVPATLFYYRLQQAAPHAGIAHLSSGEFQLTVPRSEFFAFALNSATMRNAYIVAAINTPGAFVELLISLPTSWPSSWHPENIPVISWRALSYPFFSLPAWWLVGLGLDALLGWRRTHLALLITGTVFASFFLFLALGLQFALPIADRGGAVPWAMWGLGLWTILFGILPGAWLRQWRIPPTVRAESERDTELTS
jgi:hypothetical protein